MLNKDPGYKLATLWIENYDEIMAEASIPLPKFEPTETDPCTPWRAYKDDIDNYFIAAGLEKVDDVRKIAILLSGMPSKYRQTKKTFQFEDDAASKKYVNVLKEFDKHFEPKKLLKAYLRKFDETRQNPNESISDYVTRLREVADHCQFGTLLDTQLCKQLSLGVNDAALREKLWSEDLTLQQTIEKCHLHEQRLGSRQMFAEAQSSTKEVHAFSRSRGRGRYHSRGRGSHSQGRGTPSRGRGRGFAQMHEARQDNAQSRGHACTRGYGSGHGSASSSCSNCGQYHPPKRCPAYYKRCHKCNKQGHFESMCRSKTVHTVQTDFNDNYVSYDAYDDVSYDLVPNVSSLNIYSLHSQENVNGKDHWSVLLRTPYENGRGAIKMHIDTQAQCNVLSMKSFSRMAQHAPVKLVQSSNAIAAFGGSTVTPCGRTSFNVVLKSGELYKLHCEVVSGDVPNILSAQDSQRMGFVKRVYVNKVSRNVNKVKDVKDVKPEVKSNNVTQAVSQIAQRIPQVEKVPESVKQIVQGYEDRFPTDGIGKIPGQWSLHLDPDYKDGPVAHGPRPLPAAMQEATKAQLDYLEKHEIITKVPKGTPTPWCSQLHVVHKKDGKSVRICIDPKFLNRALLREYHPLNTLEQVLTKTKDSQYFSVLDANMGYYQLQLDYDSQLLTAFHTPWGRYMYKRLPMGIKSAPEMFQRAMEEVLVGIDHVSVIFDDILIHTRSLDEHHKVLHKVLERARQNGMTFRLSKCMFAQQEVEYTGHILTPQGVKAAPDKVKPIIEMSPPTSVEELRTFLGMVTYLSKYIQNFSELTEPLRQALKQRDSAGRIATFNFGKAQMKAFLELKQAISKAPVMRYYSLMNL